MKGVGLILNFSNKSDRLVCSDTCIFNLVLIIVVCNLKFTKIWYLKKGLSLDRNIFTSLAYDWILVVPTSLYEVGGFIGE